MKTFKLHLIRHGMTAGNLQGLYIGSGTGTGGKTRCGEKIWQKIVSSARFFALWRQLRPRARHKMYALIPIV